MSITLPTTIVRRSPDQAASPEPLRRTAAACPWLAAHHMRYTPARGVPGGRVSALVRPHGHPLGLVDADGRPGDPAGLRRVVVVGRGCGP
jgi:hypothetical protein